MPLAKVRIQSTDKDTQVALEDLDVLTSADSILFDDESTLQDKFDTGELIGPQGEAATIEVGTVTTVENDVPAEVTNSGTEHFAVFDFKLPKGKDGINFKVRARYESESELIADHPDGSGIDGGYMIGRKYYFWDIENKKWAYTSEIVGLDGQDGISLFVVDEFATVAELLETFPTGEGLNGGCLVDGIYYYWNITHKEWRAVGALNGVVSTIEIGKVISGDVPSVVNVGTSTHAVLDIVLQRGEKGDTGETGAKGDPGLTTSVNSIEQVEGNINLTLDDIPDGEYRSITTKANMSNSIPITVSTNWIGVAAPYTQEIIVPGLSSVDSFEIVQDDAITEDQLTALVDANIIRIEHTETSGTIRLYAYHIKPTIELPLVVIKRGDL